MDIPTSIRLAQNTVQPKRVIKIKHTPASERASVKTIAEFKEWKKKQEFENKVKNLPEDVEGIVKKQVGIHTVLPKEIKSAKSELDEVKFVRNKKHYPFSTFMKAVITFGLDVRAGKDVETMTWPMDSIQMGSQYDEGNDYLPDILHKYLKKVAPKLNKALSYGNHFYWHKEDAIKNGFADATEQAINDMEELLTNQYDEDEESESEDEEDEESEEEESEEERRDRRIKKKMEDMVYHFPVVDIEKNSPYWKSSDFVDEMPVLRALAKDN